MGKGDKRTAKGKRIIGSSGVSRQKKKNSYVAPEPAPKKTVAKKATTDKKAAPKKTTAKKTTTTKKAAPKKTAAKKETSKK